MKLFFILLFASASSLACPELRGTFRCELNHRISTVKFETSVTAGNYSYFINSREFVADSGSHKRTDSDGALNYSASCHDHVWTLSSTIFQKNSPRIQVGAAVFTQLDEKTVVYAWDATLYSTDGAEIVSVPTRRMLCKLASN